MEEGKPGARCRPLSAAQAVEHYEIIALRHAEGVGREAWNVAATQRRPTRRRTEAAKNRRVADQVAKAAITTRWRKWASIGCRETEKERASTGPAWCGLCARRDYLTSA